MERTKLFWITSNLQQFVALIALPRLAAREVNWACPKGVKLSLKKIRCKSKKVFTKFKRDSYHRMRESSQILLYPLKFYSLEPLKIFSCQYLKTKSNPNTLLRKNIKKNFWQHMAAKNVKDIIHDALFYRLYNNDIFNIPYQLFTK